jgi:addiction module HigA family antidote
LELLSLSVTEVVEDLGLSRKTLSKIINERGSITPEMALGLSKAFNTSAELWLNLQTTFDLWIASENLEIGKNKNPRTCLMLPG